MKFYNSMGPNPKAVRMLMAEKGIKIDIQEVDLMKGENRQPPFSENVNVAGQLPALELDNGDTICEITAISEYLDETSGGTSLFGATPEERAETRMWTRRVDLNICEPAANGFRFGEGLKLFESRIVCLPEASDGLKKIAQDRLAWLNGLMEGKEWIAGNRFSYADIHLFAFLEFASGVGQPLNPENKNIAAWYERVKARPSAAS